MGGGGGERRSDEHNARERAIRRDKKGTKRRNLRILFYHDSRVDAPPYFLTPLLTESSQPAAVSTLPSTSTRKSAIPSRESLLADYPNRSPFPREDNRVGL